MDYVVAFAAYGKQIIDVLMTQIVVRHVVDLQNCDCPAPLAPAFSRSQDFRA